MATYYWVGGTGTWNASTVTNWASSSGGAGGAGVPTSADNVIFDTNSGVGTVSVTISSGVCADITVTATQALTISGTALTCYGSVSLPSGGSTVFSGLGFLMVATTTGKTFTTNGKTISALTFGGAGGGGWTLGSNLTASSISVNAGTFDTAGYTITASSLLSNVTTTRTILLRSSTITLSTGAALTINATNLTFDAGTSSISLTATSAILSGGGVTFYNVSFTNGAGVTQTLSGNNTFNNLTIAAYASAGYKTFTFTGNQTINGTFTVSSSGIANRRVLLTSNTIGVQYTLTAAAVSLAYVDFYGIIGAGAASWTGTSIGNGTLNSGITFTAPKTVYWNLAAGGNWMTSTAWATTSGGAPAVANFPLPQDTAIIDDAGISTNNIISFTAGGILLCNIDASSRTLAVRINFNATVSACGNITFSSSVVSIATSSLSTYGSITVTSAGVTLTPPITITVGASLTTSGTLTSSSSLINNGTLTLGANVTAVTCTLGAASTTNFGTNKILLTGSGSTIFTGNATQTVTGTPVVECTYSGATGTRTIVPAPSSGSIPEANVISFNITAGTDIVTFPITAGVYMKNLNFTGFSGSASNAGALNGIYGNLTLSSGMTSFTSSVTTTFRGTSGTKTITTAGKTLDFPITFDGAGSTWQLVDNLTQGSTRATKLTNGTLDLNGKTFSAGTFTIEAGTKNITFNGGILNVTGSGSAFSNANPTGFTTTAGTGSGIIRMSGSTAKTFAGGGSTYNCTLENYSTSALTISGSNTFTTLLNTFLPATWTFTSGTTTTLTNWIINGISGSLVTINATSTSQATLSKASGTVSVSYCTISYSNATGGATWESLTTNGNTNGGNNSGWIFSYFNGNSIFFGSNF